MSRLFHGPHAQPFSAKQESAWSGLACLFLLLTLNQCVSAPPPSDLPPSASDLRAIGRDILCQTRSSNSITSITTGFQEATWGGGTEFYQHLTAPDDHHQWLIFNEDKILVGAVTVYTTGLSLDPYPQLRKTLAQLPPSKEFFLNSSQLLQDHDPDSAILYRTGEATTTHQYVVRKRKKQDDQLIMTLFLLDPYERLMEEQHQRFLSYMTLSTSPTSSQTAKPPDSSAHEFLGRQQFARGELSLFGSCGTKHPDIALEAYRQALAFGLPDASHRAEAHHHMGLTLKSLGKFAEAKTAIEEALALQPHSATILNSYGTVLHALNRLPESIQAYEQALALKPDYAHARFNLAESLELVNPKRAMQEYETFLILVEDNSQEAPKAQLAKQKIKDLQLGHR